MNGPQNNVLPAWLLELLQCPHCRSQALRQSAGAPECGACGHRPRVEDQIIDLMPDSQGAPTPIIDRAYEGTMGEHYAKYMDSVALQRLDAWLLGLSVSRYNKETLAHLARLPAGPSLDMPCGGAPFLQHAEIYRTGGPWLFADLSWTMLRRVKAKCQRLGLQNVVFARIDARHLPIADGALRNIVSLFGLHCFHDKSAVFSEWRRCLAADGQSFVTTLTDDGPFLSRLYVALNRYDHTFAPDNALPTIQGYASAQALALRGIRRLGAVVMFEALHA